MYRLLYVLFISLSFYSLGQIKPKKDYRPPAQINYLLSFQETQNSLRHDFDPWQETTYHFHGQFYMFEDMFCKRDTLTVANGKKYESKSQIDSTALLNLSYGRAELRPVSKNDYENYLINTARYTPFYILDYTMHQDIVWNWYNEKYAVKKLSIGTQIVEIYTRTKSNKIEKITATKHDNLHGDITTTFRYGGYVTKLGTTYPTEILIEKMNGHVIDTVEITKIERRNDLKLLLEKPTDYSFVLDEDVEIKCEVTKYNSYIYFFDLLHTDDRVLVVEFEDFVLVAEAPVSPENGAMIITQVKALIPNKPIKYFVFGHHHPHYLGGIRAFIHNETTIISRESNKAYVEYLAQAKHTIQPDSLQLFPKDLKLEIIEDKLILGSKRKMEIYFIGHKSAHTNDYLIYYFPEDKLLFQDDLCWIPAEGEIKKAGDRQAGLYQSIVELGLPVDTIIQSWPLSGRNVKTVFSFSDLKQSVEMGGE